MKCRDAYGNLAIDLYVSNTQLAWDSRTWPESGMNWTLDVNKDGTPDCDGQRPAPSPPPANQLPACDPACGALGYTFSPSYGQTNPWCSSSTPAGNLRWGYDGYSAGCLAWSGSGWTSSGEIWVLAPAPSPPSPPSSPPSSPSPRAPSCGAGDNAGDCAVLLECYAAWGNKPYAWAASIAGGASLCSWSGMACSGGRASMLCAF